MNRKKGFAATIVLLFCFAMILPAGAQTVTLKLIETSDVHGSFFPYDFIKAKEVPSSLAQVYAYVKEQRANPDQHVILLDNGDILQGQPTVYYSNFEKTDSMHICAEVMNFMQYDASIFGNHDVEAGHAVYDKLTQEFEFPWLAANAVRADTGEPYLGAYAMFEKRWGQNCRSGTDHSRRTELAAGKSLGRDRVSGYGRKRSKMGFDYSGKRAAGPLDRPVSFRR